MVAAASFSFFVEAATILNLIELAQINNNMNKAFGKEASFSSKFTIREKAKKLTSKRITRSTRASLMLRHHQIH